MALIPQERLESADKILFLTKLALGDFAYQQQFFKALAKRHPKMKIHLWVDDTRMTWRFWRWRRERQDALYDWLGACPFIAKVHVQAESLAQYRARMREARALDYPIVVGLSTIRPWFYARFAGWIAPNAFRVGGHRLSRHLNFLKSPWYSTLSARWPVKSAGAGRHITDAYADRFKLLFDLDVQPADRLPSFDLPREFVAEAAAKIAALGGGPMLFVNPFSKGKPRSWTLDQVRSLIEEVRKRKTFGENPLFVVNAPPDKADSIRALASARVVPFTADRHFFQLPAMMSQADVIVSVDTATTHFANGVKKPLVALMRSNNPEWTPLDTARTTILKPNTREQWVKDIPVGQVADALETTWVR